MGCSIDGCPNPVKARSFCWKHYQRNRRHGSPHIVNKSGPKQRVVSSVVSTPPKRGFLKFLQRRAA